MGKFCLSFKPMQRKQWKPYTFYDDFNTPCDEMFFKKKYTTVLSQKLQINPLKTEIY